MAIIIPSKNIYDLKNDKIERNIFNRAEISAKAISQVAIKDNTVYSHTVGTAERKAQSDSEAFATAIYNHAPQYAHFVSACTAAEHDYSTYTFDVPKFTENMWIKQVHGGTADATVLCTLKEGTYTQTAATVIRQSLETLNNDGQTFYAQSTTERSHLVGLPQKTLTDTYGNISMPKALSYTSNASIAPSDGSATLFVNANLTLPSPIATVSVISEDSEKVTVQCVVLTNLTIYKGSHTSNGVKTWQGDSGATASVDTYNYTLAGTYAQYSPNSVMVHIFGNAVNLSLEEGTITVGAEPGANVFSLQTSNELMQTDNYYGTPSSPLAQTLYENTLRQYEKGKETATIICDISEYYNEDGTLAKSISDTSVPMLFNLYDKVIPMVFTADGKDYPMSLYKDRSPKVFEIHGIERYFDGAVWQKIYLQEI
jgi:hypothetical protein